MPIYFVQHGVAVPEGVDPNRPLSAHGRREIEGIAAYLRKVGISVKKVCHSGKTRAKETAQILAEYVGDGITYEIPGMKPNDSVAPIAAGLKHDQAMYVGHLPHLGKLVSHLVAGDENADVVRFVNGGVVCVERNSESYHIEWYLTPSLCRV